MSWIFPLDCVVCSLGGVGLGGLGGGRGVGGAHRISHLEKADVRSFGARAVFPRCHCFRFHLREDSRLHTSPFFFCFVFLLWVRYTGLRTCLKFWGEFRSFFFFLFFSNHGGHRGSRLEPAAPVGPALYSSDQRVRHLTERLAAYCWSGKKWPEESPLRRTKSVSVLLFPSDAHWSQSALRSFYLT